jgi:hypothetical protein
MRAMKSQFFSYETTTSEHQEFYVWRICTLYGFCYHASVGYDQDPASDEFFEFEATWTGIL